MGIEVTQHPKFIFISQKKYIGDLLNKFGMYKCNPLTTPMEQNLKLTSIEWKDIKMYHIDKLIDENANNGECKKG